MSRVTLAILACGLLASAGAARAADLTIATAGIATSADPHFYNASPNNSLATQIFDRLTERTFDGKLFPGLALRWTPVGETEWEFTLRPNVTWHDGKPFTADDVVFSFTRARNVPNSPGGFGGFLRGIKAVSATGPLTLRIETKDAWPGMPGEIANVAIVSRHAGEGATTADYNSGAAAIGTGAFRFRSFTPGDRVVLERNPDWWGGRVDWDRATYRMMPNAASRTAALLSRDVDMIEMPSSSDLPRLRASSDVTVSSGPGLRVIYLTPSFDTKPFATFIADNDGKPLPENPLLKREVRQALSLAIQRDAIAGRVMEDTAQATAQLLPPDTFSHDPGLTVTPPDPARARALLRQAGYPEGFRLTLHVPADRYPNAPVVGQAIAQMWTRIGVRTSVTSLPWNAYSAQLDEMAIHLIGLGNGTFDATSILVNVLSTRNQERGTGASNRSGYSNLALDALIGRALGTFDDARREGLMRDATRMAMEDVAIMPLYHQRNTWALRRGLRYDPRADERTLAKDVRVVSP